MSRLLCRRVRTETGTADTQNWGMSDLTKCQTNVQHSVHTLKSHLSAAPAFPGPVVPVTADVWDCVICCFVSVVSSVDTETPPRKAKEQCAEKYLRPTQTVCVSVMKPCNVDYETLVAAASGMPHIHSVLCAV